MTTPHVIAENLQAGGSIQVAAVVNNYNLFETAGGEPTELTAQFDIVKSYLDQYEVSAALAILHKLEKEQLGRFTPYTWYRFYALRGHAYRITGEINQAATDYFRAKQSQPDLDRAQALEVLACQLLDEGEKASRLANELRERFPHSGMIASLWLQSMPLIHSLDELESVIPANLRSDPEVLMGFAIAASQRADARTQGLARKALDASPNWVEAKIIWATSILIPYNHAELPVLSEDDCELIREARTCLAESIEIVRRASKPSQVAQLFLNLSAASQLLKDRDAADEVLKSARRLAPTDEQVLLQEARRLARGRKLGPAISILESATIEASPHIKLLLAQLRAKRGEGEDHKVALDVLRDSLEAAPVELLSSWLETMGKLYLITRDFDGAKRFLVGTEAVQGLSPLVRLTLIGWAEHHSENVEEAKRLSLDAFAQISDTSDPLEVVDAARLLEDVHELKFAFAAYRRIITPSSSISLIRHIFALALKDGAEDYVLTLGEELRKSGTKDLGVIEAELAVLEKRSPRRTMEFIQAILATESEGLLSRYLRMRLTHVGIHLNNPELIEKDADKLPQLDEIDERLAAAAVEAICRSDDPLRAVAFAYELARRDPDAERYHHAMIGSMGLLGGGKAQVIPVEERVGANSAVRLREIPSDTESWYVIEQTRAPKTTLNEIAIDSRLGQAIVGKTIDDEVEFEESLGSTRRVKIVKLLHKFVFRYQDCIENLPNRFPDQSLLKVFHVNEKASPQDAFAEMLTFMGKMSQREDDAAAMYRDQSITLQMLASAIGRSLCAAISLLAPKGYVIKCVPGSPDERERGLEAIRSSDAVVVEPTALVTAFLLNDSFGVDLFESIAQWPMRVLVAEQAIEDIERVQRDLSSGNDRLAQLESAAYGARILLRGNLSQNLPRSSRC